MGRRITLSLSPLPGRARLFFRRMYFSVCPVWFSQLASPKDPTHPILRRITYCVYCARFGTSAANHNIF